jgi:hypothetical protein
MSLRCSGELGVGGDLVVEGAQDLGDRLLLGEGRESEGKRQEI